MEINWKEVPKGTKVRYKDKTFNEPKIAILLAFLKLQDVLKFLR